MYFRLVGREPCQHAAEHLAERPLLRRDTFTREPSTEGLPPEPEGAPRLKVTLWELMEAFRVVLKRATPDPVHHVASEGVSLRARIDSLLSTLGVARQVTFESLFGDQPTRGYVIVTFLAVLELMKQHVVEALQEAIMGPILITLTVDDVRTVAIDLLEEYDGSGAPEPEPEPAQPAEE